MSHTSWSSPAALGPAPSYHPDPSPGGTPVFSPDGHWRWAVDHWELRDDPEDPGDPGDPGDSPPH